MSSWRAERINEEVRRETEDIIRSLKDPGLKGIVSVLRAEVTKDMAYAKVFVSVYGTKKQAESTLDVLKRAAGHIRSALASRVNLRRTPMLMFELDDSIEYAARISGLIDKVVREDENR